LTAPKTTGSVRCENEALSSVLELCSRYSTGRHRVLLMLEAYFDESETKFAFGLGGYLACAEEWKNFDGSWAKFLADGSAIVQCFSS